MSLAKISRSACVMAAATAVLQFSTFDAGAAESWHARYGNRFRYAVQDRIKPISVNVVDPATRVYRLPSGRIFIADPVYARQSERRYHGRNDVNTRPRAPYAPPAFYIIGEPSRKNMDKPVALNHGIKPRRGLNTQPNVVFLVLKPGKKTVSVKN